MEELIVGQFFIVDGGDEDYYRSYGLAFLAGTSLEITEKELNSSNCEWKYVE